MKIYDFSKTNSILNAYISQLRDINIQKDRMRFRRNIERIGEILTYELSKNLDYKLATTNTPLDQVSEHKIADDLIVCSILRAGIPLHQGILNYLDQTDNAFISAYRKPVKANEEVEVEVEYLSTPDLTGKTLIIADPMLATGKSMLNVYEALLKVGQPKQIHIMSVIAAPEGVDYLNKNLPENISLWIAQIDECLNEKSYIVPGLGDAGDLAYGNKL
ncbi:MAG: uracil phosphoribosyltransferase [Bacteroidota bacterium]